MGSSSLILMRYVSPIPVYSLVVKNLGIDAAREAAKKQVLDLKFEPEGDTSLSEPKFGKEDPNNEAHTGGNTWAGGVSVS